MNNKQKQKSFLKSLLLKTVIINLSFLLFWFFGQVNIFGLKDFFDPITKENVILILGLNLAMIINTILEKFF